METRSTIHRQSNAVSRETAALFLSLVFLIESVSSLRVLYENVSLSCRGSRSFESLLMILQDLFSSSVTSVTTTRDGKFNVYDMKKTSETKRSLFFFIIFNHLFYFCGTFFMHVLHIVIHSFYSFLRLLFSCNTL